MEGYISYLFRLPEKAMGLNLGHCSIERDSRAFRFKKLLQNADYPFNFSFSLGFMVAILMTENFVFMQTNMAACQVIEDYF